MKGLEALHNIAINHTRFGNGKDFETIEKELKALEIIKNKNVDINSLRFSSNLDWYNSHNHYLLTQEEFDFLKEILL